MYVIGIHWKCFPILLCEIVLNLNWVLFQDFDKATLKHDPNALIQISEALAACLEGF